MDKAQNMTKLKKILEDKKMSQADLIRLITKKTGKTYGRTFMSRLVNGKYNMTLKIGLNIAQALEVRFEEIYDGQL